MGDGTKTVLCFGDSNTHGSQAIERMGEQRRFDRSTRWPGAMAKALGPEVNVIEEGLPGRTTLHNDPIEGDHKNGLTALPILLETHRPIDLVVVMLGTNDLKARFSVSAAEIAKSVGRLVNVIKATPSGPGQTSPDVLIVSPVPIKEVGVLADMFREGIAKSEALAPLLEALAIELDTGFFDAGTIATVSDVDGIHLTAEGQIALGQTMVEVVRKRLARSD